MTIQDLFKDSRARKFNKGEIIIRGDDDPSGVYYIDEGFVKMSTIFADGSEFAVTIFKKGSFFPMIWAIGGVPNEYYYQSINTCTLRKISKTEFENYIKRNPKALSDLTRRVLIGLDGVVTNLKYLVNGNALCKVSAVIIVMAKRFGKLNKKNETEIELPLSHQEIANFAGLSRETVSLALVRIQKKGVIKRKGKIMVIKDMEKLLSYLK